MVRKFDALVGAARARLEAPRHPPQGAPRRPSGGQADRRGREAARSVGQARGRHPALPARGRRRHGHGRHQRRPAEVRERLRGHLGLRDDRAGEEPREGPRGDRHRGHTRRQARRDGPLQQRLVRLRRLDQPLRPGGQGAGARGEPRASLREAHAAGAQGRPGRGRATLHQLRLRRARHRLHRGPAAVRAQAGQRRSPLENFIRAMLYASLCAMRTGMDILTERRGWSSRRSAATAASSRAATPASA